MLTKARERFAPRIGRRESMTTMVWSILALVVIIVLIAAGIVIWRKRTDAQVDSLHNIEKQLGEIGDELKTGIEEKPAEPGAASESDGKPEEEGSVPEESESAGESVPEEDVSAEECGDVQPDLADSESGGAAEAKASEAKEHPAAEGTPDEIQLENPQETSDAAGAEPADGVMSIELPEEDPEIPDEPDEDSDAEEENAEPVVIDIADILGSRFSDDEDSGEAEAAAKAPDGETENLGMQRRQASLYNTGKSGKVYTEEELELLIKE